MAQEEQNHDQPAPSEPTPGIKTPPSMEERLEELRRLGCIVNPPEKAGIGFGIIGVGPVGKKPSK